MQFKRVFWMTAILFTVFVVAASRVAHIALGSSVVTTADFGAHITVVVDSPRGTVFDRDMQAVTNDVCVYKAVLTGEPEVLAAVYEYFDYDRAQEIVNMLKSGNPVVVEVPEDFVCKKALKFRCFKTPKRAAIHTVGYTGWDTAGVCGIEAAFEAVLKSDGDTTVRFESDALGRAINVSGAEIVLNTKKYDTGVVTTLDKEVQNICDGVEIKKGAVVVLDCKSGEILAISSFPSFDVDKMESALEDPDHPFVNRALERYNVGSIFKTVVLAAAFENGIIPENYTCTGKIEAGQEFNCNKKEGHGNVDYTTAFINSCNTYFINLSQKIGMGEICETAKLFDISQPTVLCDGVVGQQGLLPDPLRSQSLAALANLSIGQGDVMMTPLHIAGITAAIANGGLYCTPTLIKGVVGENQTYVLTSQSKQKRVISQRTADTLKELMIKTVESGTGTLAKPSKGGAGGKTATAETGIQKPDGSFSSQAWFTGFYPADDPKYVITVLCEEGNSGGGDAAPVFKKICDGIAGLK